MDNIENKLLALRRDLSRRDSVALRMYLHEASHRGVYDAELDQLTAGAWMQGFDDDRWLRLNAD
jgi:hypothetical protein